NGRLLPGGNRHGENIGGKTDEARTAVGVGRVDGDSLARQADLTFQASGDFIDHERRHTAVIDGNENGWTIRIPPDGQCLGPEPLLDSFGFRFARGVTGQANRIIGRDIDSRDADLERGLASRNNGGHGKSGDEPEKSREHTAIVSEQATVSSLSAPGGAPARLPSERRAPALRVLAHSLSRGA